MLPEKSESQIFEIMDYKYPDFIEKINYLIRKANKLNLPPIVYNITGKFEKIIKIWDSERINSIDCKVTIYTVEISGFRPAIAGFSARRSLGSPMAIRCGRRSWCCGVRG